jgi:hypothetical protein
MHVRTYVCVCVYVKSVERCPARYMYACTYVCMHVCVCISVCEKCGEISTKLHIYVCVCVYLFVRIHTFMCVSICVYTHIRTHTYIERGAFVFL